MTPEEIRLQAIELAIKYAKKFAESADSRSIVSVAKVFEEYAVSGNRSRY